jgi:hypothetical protein
VKTSPQWSGLCLCVVLLASGGCGIVGPPIPPETVGVAPIIEKQKRQQGPQPEPQPKVIDDTSNEGSQFIEPRGQDEELPPLRPIGTR